MKMRNRIKQLEARRRGHAKSLERPSHNQTMHKPGSLKK